MWTGQTVLSVESVRLESITGVVRGLKYRGWKPPYHQPRGEVVITDGP